ncbi:tRNA pseudouridine(13) synthase TruD [Candidatus Woesearchaeota archaeon]|nr:tRNA pseudouridine(13) synthase TruD [Candidatus Woesearchaeota archaeon]
MAYIIKQQPQDFIVKEIFNPTLQQTGNYTYFLLKKTNYTTLNAVQKIAKMLRIPLKHIGFAGTKDKHAVTEQICSAKNVNKEQIEKIKIKDIQIKFIGYADKPASLGDHEGNHFIIVVRNISQEPPQRTKFINYFGEQRFSINNSLIGKLIVQKKFKEATEILNEHTVKAHLQQHPQDYLGAIKTLPIKQLKFYIHAYQSKLWNELAATTKETTLSLIGFGTKETSIIKEILKKENITTRDFIIKPFPELSSEGGERTVFVEATNIKISALEDDELNQGMKKTTITFTLAKGSYATEFIRQLF